MNSYTDGLKPIVLQQIRMAGAGRKPWLRMPDDAAVYWLIEFGDGEAFDGILATTG